MTAAERVARTAEADRLCAAAFDEAVAGTAEARAPART